MDDEKKNDIFAQRSRTPPVKTGDVLTITPSGYGKTDPFYNYGGFIIFIKDTPPHAELSKPCNIRITSVKKTFAFAIYEGIGDTT